MGHRKLVATVAGACVLGLVTAVGVTALIGTAGASSHNLKAKYEINLTGFKGPDVRDPDGFGTSKVVVKQSTLQACVTTKKVGNIPLPSVGHHIHSGGSNTNGPIVVPLAVVTAKPSKPGKPPKLGKSAKLCGTTSEANILSMINNPELWYVNVHSTEFPGGAIRSQLSG
jgi:hypothetical protein